MLLMEYSEKYGYLIKTKDLKLERKSFFFLCQRGIFLQAFVGTSGKMQVNMMF